MEDTRLDWMRDVVYKFLNIRETDEAFNELLERDVLCSRSLYTLFSGSSDAVQSAFFYDTLEEDEVELENVEEEAGSSSESTKLTSKAEGGEDRKSDSEYSNFDKEEKNEMDIIDNDLESVNEAKVDDLSIAEKTSNIEMDDEQNLPDQDEPDMKSKTSLLQIQQKVVLKFCPNIKDHVPGQRYVYFLLHKLEPVPLLDTLDEAMEIMPKHFKFGIINKHPLIHLEEVSSLAYFPLFSKENITSHILRTKKNASDIQISETFLEFNKITTEFSETTKEISEQIGKPFMIQLPDYQFDCLSVDFEEDSAFIAEAEDLASEWNIMTKYALDDILIENPPDLGILEEIQFWKKRKSNISTCWDQLCHSLVQKTIQTLERKESPISKQFRYLEHEIEKDLKIAAENVNYLLCLEPNVKILHTNSPEVVSIKALDALLCMLELIWVQSDYYKDISNMQRLLKGITSLLKKKVMDNTNVKRLFSKDLNEIKVVTSESAELLNYWKESYMKECDIVRQYGGLYRWGFDIKTFFDETDHMISVCHDLEKVAQIMEQLNNVFKTNLKHLVQDTRGLVLLETRVLGITARIQYADFDVFDPVFQVAWEKTMTAFYQEVKDLEEEIKNYIAKTLRSGLSWENAAMLARSFNRVHVSKTVLDFINKSNDEMLNQYIKEIFEIENEFLSCKDEPPQFDLIPSYASAIVWNHDMLIKLTTPMSQISQVKSSSKKDAEVQARFKKAETSLTAYKQEIYELWKAEANENLNKFLQAKLLRKDFSSKLPDKSDGSTAHISSAKLQEAMSYKVNFLIHLEQISIQAKLLEFLKFDIPVSVRNTILRENIYFDLRIQISSTLERLQNKLAELTPSESSLLSEPFKEICNVLDLGINHYQWDSAEVPEFIIKMKQATDVLISLITQIKSIVKEIDLIIKSISTCDIINFNPHNSVNLPTCEVYFDEAEREMNVKVKKVVGLYHSLLPFLHKLESVTCHTTTGRPVQLKQFYRHCEEEVLKSLIKMILLNLDYFKLEVMDHFIFPYVQAACQYQDELVIASTKRIKLVFVVFVGNIIKSTQRFVRWLDGTCIESLSFNLPETNEKMELSYFLDLSLHPNIKRLVLSIIQKMFIFMDNIKTKGATM